MQDSEVKELLMDLSAEAEEAYQLFDTPIAEISKRENLKVISGKYSELKGKYLSIQKSLIDKERQRELSPAEQFHLLPTINELVSSCSASKGSMDEDKLNSCFYDITDYLSNYIHEIDS